MPTIYQMYAPFLACSVSTGAIDADTGTSERVNLAIWVLAIGLVVLVVHVSVFAFRSRKKQRKSGWVFWSVLILSIVIIPAVLFMVMVSAGMSCGIGASNGPAFLLVFQLVGFAAQLATWKFSNQSNQSPVPLD